MYQHLLSTDDILVMLGESLNHHTESNLDNVENNNSTTVTSHSTGANINKTRHALFKKGSRRVRSTASNYQNSIQRSQQQNQKHGLLRINNPVRRADINNNAVMRPKSPVLLNAEPGTNKSQAAVLGTHLLKVGSKRELLKSKTGRPERSSQLGNQTIYGPSKCEQPPPNVSNRGQKSRCSAAGKTSVKKSDNSCHQRPQSSSKEVKKPFSIADNISLVNLCQPEFVPEDSLKDGEKVYAGAKFSEPPSPSVLPKPPSHWVGENAPPCAGDGREQMTSHLKSLLKVPDKP
ncbi:proline-rich nuclear receptor coactivator 1 [Sardina pilchardus]|uniref:proline-rich nuclear receptor coactivator 1 n=1 Tax=Sardina pilchardus TaxID=27697 RepID=UPI002E12408A